MSTDPYGRSLPAEPKDLNLTLQWDHPRAETQVPTVDILSRENRVLLARIEELELKLAELERRLAEHRQQHLLW